MSVSEQEYHAAGGKQTAVTMSGVFIENMKAIRHYVSSFFTSEQDVEDVIQDLYLRLVEREYGAENIRHPRAFVYKVARNLSLNQRAYAHQRQGESLTLAQEENLMQSASLDDVIEQQQRYEHFCQAVNALPAQCRRVFIMKKIEGRSNSDIAAALKISLSTVDTHLARGLIACSKHLRKQGHGEMHRVSRNAPSNTSRAANHPDTCYESDSTL